VIASLADAWHWYETARRLVRTMERLGQKHWNSLPWDGDLGRDDHLKGLISEEILNDSQMVLDDLDDLCVLLLFSVFEATIRERVLAEVEAELPPLRHVAIKRALDEMKEGIEHGSFFKVLEPYKDFDADLIEQVNQVRRYRNWVAHGRRTEQPSAVNPAAAYDRLKRFLDQSSAYSAPVARPLGHQGHRRLPPGKS
jgi:hypothetical protein